MKLVVDNSCKYHIYRNSDGCKGTIMDNLEAETESVCVKWNDGRESGNFQLSESKLDFNSGKLIACNL